jgi:hypothetical protein
VACKEAVWDMSPADVWTVKLDFKGTHWDGVDLIQLADYSGHWQGVL